MFKKLLCMTTTFLIVFILSARYSQAMYFPSAEGLGEERAGEAKSYAISHPEFFVKEDQDLEMGGQYKILEEAYRRTGHWWQIVKSEWGTVGVSTAEYFAFLDENMVEKTRWASAVILTPFSMAVGIFVADEVDAERLERQGEKKYLFKEEEIELTEMSTKIFELSTLNAWAFYMPFIVYSFYSFPPETKYVLRYYPEDYMGGIDEKGEAEAVYVAYRESVVEDTSTGFFYYLAFPTEKILFSPTASVSFNEETSEVLGRMVLTVVTNAGEELIFPFNLSEMR